MITIGSLFSGACDGIALGLQWLGLGPVLWHAESDPWRRRVLARHWPDAILYDDVRHVGTSEIHVPVVDLVCGGFPCTGMSQMGKRKGFDDDRSALWSEFSRILGDLRPSLAVVENTAAATLRGWLRVVADLTELGFDTEWLSLRGTDVGYPVGRERVFLLASSGEIGREKLRAAHDDDRGDAPGQLAHRHGALVAPPGPGSLATLRAWQAEHGGPPCGVRRDVARIPDRVERVGSLGDSAMPVLVVEAWRRLRDRMIAA